MTKPYKLKLTKLSFLSSVDAPAQGDGAKALLLKSANGTVSITARVTKMSDDLGLVFGHAFAASLDGGATPHVDSQNDAIDPDFLKTAMEFIEAGGATDVNHDFEADGRIVFAWPLLPEVNDALGIKSDVVGLAVAVKPSPETYAKFKSGELTGFSIAGRGEREPFLDEKPDPSIDKTNAAQSKSTRIAAIDQRPIMETKIVVLTDAQHAHYAKLASAEADAFLSKSTAERDAVIADIAKADPVVYKTTSGVELRKSHGDIALMLAKQADASAEQVAKATEIANVEKSARDLTELKKRASETMPNLAGSDDVHCAILKAIDSIVDEKVRGEAVAALKAANDAAKERAVAKGITGGDPSPGDALAEFNAGVKKFAEANSIKDEGVALERFLGTPDGRIAKRAYDASRAYGKQPS